MKKFIGVWFGLVFLITYVSIFNQVLLGNFAFWSDPARDLTLAVDNLHKFSLIGPPSGIPNVFYGPYWIWLLSVCVFISKDPRFATFMIATIPYCFLLAFFLWKFSRFLGKTTVALLFVLFTFSNFFGYATNLWNPNVTPVLFLVFSYFFSQVSLKFFTKSAYVAMFVLGFLAGILINFSYSFGSGILIGSFIFLLLDAFFLEKFDTHKYVNQLAIRFSQVVTFGIGIFFAFIPFFLFEIRHHFLQTQGILKLFYFSIFLGSGVVGRQGILGWGRVTEFFVVFGQVLRLHEWGVYGIILLLLACGIFYRKAIFKEIVKGSPRIRLSAFLLCILAALVYIYTSSKNPIWDYHFIGVDIIYLLLIGIVISYSQKLTALLFLWVGVLTLLTVPIYMNDIRMLGRADYRTSSLATKAQVVDTIGQDAKNKAFQVFAYNPAIYVYDFNYLTLWKLNRESLYQPVVKSQEKDLVYIIAGKVPLVVKTDFIHYVTPEKRYKTEREFLMGDGITITKRVRK